MFSSSHAAQEKLRLPDNTVPFNEQISIALEFIGLHLDDIYRPSDVAREGEKTSSATFHGKQEWLLRWLLLKMQKERGDVPRRSPSSWRLFLYLVRNIPVVKLAGILVERKFMIHILLQTLLEAQAGEVGVSTSTSPSVPIATELGGSVKVSKKRKRFGDVVALPVSQGLADLLTAIHAALSYLVQATKVSGTSEAESNSGFSAEYMRTVIRTTAEEAATILGSWLNLCYGILSSADRCPGTEQVQACLTPFIEAWANHAPDEASHTHFSLQCMRPLLKILQALDNGQCPDIGKNWKPELERLLASNIVVPAKRSNDQSLFGTLTKTAVSQDTGNAPVLFEIAIRSVQFHTGRRRDMDIKWLQEIFRDLQAAMPDQPEKSGEAVHNILRLAMKHKLNLPLPSLREITSKYALTGGHNKWEMISTIIQLDANVFLIEGPHEDLLALLLESITSACFEETWQDLSGHVVSSVLVPLMHDFAKARKLSGFIRHWYSQLVHFDQHRKKLSRHNLYSAWEDDALQITLRDLLLPSMTIQQIQQTLDWVRTEVEKSPNAACVILEAIAGSISGDHEHVVDAVGLSLYHIMFDEGANKKLDSRFKWRSWRILSLCLDWLERGDIQQMLHMWEAGQEKPFDELLDLSNFYSGHAVAYELVDPKRSFDDLEKFECLRFAFSAWSAIKMELGNQVESVAAKATLELIKCSITYTDQILMSLEENGHTWKPECGKKPPMHSDRGGIYFHYARCMLVQYPQALELCIELDFDMARDILRKIFAIAATQPSHDRPFASWLRLNQADFAKLWTCALECNHLRQNRTAMALLVDTMLTYPSFSNPIIHRALEPYVHNIFSVNCLARLPLEYISKLDRERILDVWNPKHGFREDLFYETEVLDQAVICMKIHIMDHPTIYEGMEFEELMTLAEIFAEDHPPEDDNASLLRELTRKIFIAAGANASQARSQNYLSDAFQRIQKKIKKAAEKNKHKLSFCLIAVFEAALNGLQTRSMTLDDMGIISKDDLDSLLATFRGQLLAQLAELMRKSRTSEAMKSSSKYVKKEVSIIAIIDALSALGIDPAELGDIRDEAIEYSMKAHGSGLIVGERLRSFLRVHGREPISAEDLSGDATNLHGRKLIAEETRAAISRSDQKERLELLQSILGGVPAGLVRLDKLLATRIIIMSVEDVGELNSRKGLLETDPDLDSDDSSSGSGNDFELSEAYTMLSERLREATDIRQFCVISECLKNVLRIKSRCMSQHNIDSTIASITIVCSQNGPSLPGTRAGVIYLHLCHLLEAVIVQHRLKLQGHTHLIQQAMQALLRCLYTPYSHSHLPPASIGLPPPWLASPQPKPLGAKHAEAYTKLLTLICDPSASSVRDRHSNNLVAAKDKAKRIASTWMKFVLEEHIKRQLDMKMLPEIKRALEPGWYAFLDATTLDSREAMRDAMDADSRAVFREIKNDWLKFAKYKG